MRAGRPRRNGSRERNGRLQRRYSLSERDPEMLERQQVLRQPHRREHGIDQRSESPLGRFTLKHKLEREYFDSGLEYGGLVRFFLHALGAQRFVHEGTNGSGLGVTAAKTRWLSHEIKRLEDVLKRLNSAGFSGLRELCVFEREISPEAEPSTIIVLVELGSLLKKTGR